MGENIKKDQMTPLERSKAIRAGQPYDRVPCQVGVADHGAKLIGAKNTDMFFSAAKNVEAQIAARKVYEIQNIQAAAGLTGMAEAIGCKVGYPENSAPFIAEHVVKAFADLNKLEIPDPRKSARLPIVLEIAERLVESLGNEVPVTVGLTGPFTTAAQIRGTENFMRDLYYNREFAHQLLRFSLDSTIAFLKEASKIEGIEFGIGDPTSSGSLISHIQFREFAFPYLKELVDEIKNVGASAPSLHICGNTKKIWGLMADAGVGLISIDDKMDLAQAKEAVGDRVIIVGNVKPTETMYLGNPKDVEEDAKNCLRKAYDSPKGYILALGCGLPNGTPPQNIHALLHSARKFGQYPLDDANFQ